MDKPYLSPEEAAKQLGICPREIRKMMRNNEIDLGIAIKKTTRSGQKGWRFYIYQSKIDKIMGGGESREEAM
ncbi:MAG: helix-turn-helix domain-containing protein [Enterocloster asparagiformis]|nr:helix-turn-helix domain-containing protein [Enterocloster asparagiformis]